MRCSCSDIVESPYITGEVPDPQALREMWVRRCWTAKPCVWGPAGDIWRRREGRGSAGDDWATSCFALTTISGLSCWHLLTSEPRFGCDSRGTRRCSAAVAGDWLLLEFSGCNWSSAQPTRRRPRDRPYKLCWSPVQAEEIAVRLLCTTFSGSKGEIAGYDEL